MAKKKKCRICAKIITLAEQKQGIKCKYNEIIEGIFVKKDVLICYISLTPTDESISYKVRIEYKANEWIPRAWLISPEMEKVNNKFPPHLYRMDKNGERELCVYTPKFGEWKSTMSIADAFIPWVVTWLYAYEIWQITGEWLYPCTKHNGHVKKIENKRKCHRYR